MTGPGERREGGRGRGSRARTGHPRTRGTGPSLTSGSGGRRSARERTLGLLYEAETKAEAPTAVLDAQPVTPDPFTVAVVRGVAERQAELDVLIGRVAKGWRIERMPVVDRVVLRMGAYELCHRPDVPTAAVISEAVELAKKFSTDNSGRFVNGVLARIAVECRAGSDDASVLDELMGVADELTAPGDVQPPDGQEIAVTAPGPDGEEARPD